MCNERERLIGYVYDECDSAERAAVQQHLDSCAECRTEITALRSVRADLQSWTVPDHESVWKPFAPAPTPAWWQQVPRWALAAAASLVLVSGAAGGAIAQAMMPQQALATPVSLTAADLEQLERRIETRLQREVAALNSRVELATSRQTVSEVPGVVRASLERQIADLRSQANIQTDAITFLNNNFEQYKKGFNLSHAALGSRVSALTSLLENR